MKRKIFRLKNVLLLLFCYLSIESSAQVSVVVGSPERAIYYSQSPIYQMKIADYIYKDEQMKDTIVLLQKGKELGVSNTLNKDIYKANITGKSGYVFKSVVDTVYQFEKPNVNPLLGNTGRNCSLIIDNLPDRNVIFNPQTTPELNPE